MRSILYVLKKAISDFVDWLDYDEAMAMHAEREVIRQEMDKHPVDRGEHWR